MGRPNLEDRPSTIDRSDRPHRVPINGYRDRLKLTGCEPGFHYAIVNEDKVPLRESQGFEFVTHDIQVGDKQINVASQIGNKISIAVGNQVTAYLMRIPQEYYDADMKAFNDDLDERDRALYSDLNSRKDGRYGEIRVEVKNYG